MSRKAKAASPLRDALEPRLHELVRELWTQEVAARDFGDPEGVHQMRVASRKLRAAIDASNGVFTRKPERRLRSQVRRLTRALGAVRDGDVLIGDMQRRLADGGSHPGLDRLIERLDQRRKTDRARLISLLDEMDTSGFRDDSQTIFTAKHGKVAKLRRNDARRMIEAPLDAFLAMTTTIPAESDVEALHRIRIATKRLRYALQLVEAPLKPDSTRVLDSLGTMQDQLGEIHNDDVLTALIRDELHILVDESIAGALAGDSACGQVTTPAWNDLLSMLLSATRERHHRYLAFVKWWDQLQETGFLSRLQDLGVLERDNSSHR